jgi:phosphate transport system substrate-binding protein
MVVDWIYNNPTWLWGSIFVVLFTSVACAGLAIFHRFVHVELRRAHNELAGFTIAIISVVYAVLLAFIAIATWEAFSVAEQVVDSEADYVSSIYRDTQGLPLKESAAIRGDLQEYFRVVVKDEWPAQRSGNVPNQGWEPLHRLHNVIVTTQPVNSGEAVIQGELLRALNNLYIARSSRLAAVQGHIPGVIWSIIFIGGLITTAFTYLFGFHDFRMHMVMTAAVAFSLALVVVLIIALDWPFRGDVSVSPNAYINAELSWADLADNEQVAVTLQGAGATFPAPIYQKWFVEYNKAHPEVQINYQPLGSVVGIKQFQQNLVDFGASDAAMTDEEMATVKNGVVLIPMTAGEIVLAYNLPNGPTELRLSRQAYVGIFLGKITNWNDPVISEANPGANLPDTEITVVTRSDASGTTFAFTSHLSAISDVWKNGPSAGKSVNFPVGEAVRGNLGVSALIRQTPGAIGYVEYGYAVQTQLPMASMENKSGRYVRPEMSTGKAALASVRLPDSLRGWVIDPPGPDSYPIVTYTWLLCYRKYKDPKIATTLKSVIKYGLTRGQSFSADLGYIRLPGDVVGADMKALDQIS